MEQVINSIDLAQERYLERLARKARPNSIWTYNKQIKLVKHMEAKKSKLKGNVWTI